MSIPEEMIMKHLDMLMTYSEPGAVLHHLHLVSAPDDAVGALGLVDESQLKVSVLAIAPDETVDSVEFIARSALAALADHRNRGETILFAALAQEVFHAPRDELGKKLQGQRRLSEHPEAAEVTLVYAVCADGRRWRGRHWLTGPRAGTRDAATLLVGRPAADEGMGPLLTGVMLRLVLPPQTFR